MTKRKMIALSLALSLSLALASCGTGSGDGPSQPDAPSGSVSPSESGTPSESAPAAQVDLKAFYDQLVAGHKADYFEPDMPIEGEYLTSYYAGLEDIPLKQQVIYQPTMSGVACEIALAEVENAGDVQKVKDIFQARVDYQVGTDDAPGGAFYPESIEGWKNNARIVSNGNYVMLIVWQDCDKFVEEFNALF